MTRISTSMLARVGVVALLVAATGCATFATSPAGRGHSATASLPSPNDYMRAIHRTPDARDKYVVIDLDVNQLRFMDGQNVLWSAPVGTGTGLYLRGESQEWTFSTPTGTFEVRRKELDPVWLLPDWHYVKQGQPIPSINSPQRRVSGALGVAAVYLGDEIAIHGTDRPELLGDRVSHGCIRLENQYALRLFHNVQVGTPVLIVGGGRVRADEVPAPTDPGIAARRESPFARVSTAELLRRLDAQIATPATRRGGEWTGIASELIARGIRDDANALRGVLARAGMAPDRAFNREYSTFVADAYMRGATRAVVSLARISAAERDRAARAIVEAAMDLYPGDPSSPAAPWPSRRVNDSALGPEGRTGWESIRRAESAYLQTDMRSRVFARR